MVDTGKIGAAPTALLRVLASGPLSPEGAMENLRLNRRQFNEAFRRLEIRGYAAAADGHVSLTPAGASAAERGEVITGGPKGQVKLVRNTFRQRAWRAMRIRKSFTIGEIVADAATEGDVQARDNAARYLCRLGQAGYVAEARQRVPGTIAGSNGFKRYRLVKNTGPFAPVFREAMCAIHDPNLGKDVSCVQP